MLGLFAKTCSLNLNLNFCNTRLTSSSRLSMQLSTNPEGKAYHSNPHLNNKIEALKKLQIHDLNSRSGRPHVYYKSPDRVCAMGQHSHSPPLNWRLVDVSFFFLFLFLFFFFFFFFFFFWFRFVKSSFNKHLTGITNLTSTTLSHFIFHISRFTFHISHFTFHFSHFTFKISLFIINTHSFFKTHIISYLIRYSL
jgi:hypothetical protein